uniref:hypothetical protein n=1 Tax=uncultured Altererythrobacter sp. TaxID=500840 RepID=UPI002610252B|nr:hypothetical protein [uncultured Altererythrobacter sp.]
MKNDLPSYVVRPGDPCHTPPYACNKTQMYNFFLEGDRKTIQEKLVDPILNAPTGGKTDYQTFSDFVMVTYSIAAEGTSTEPPDSEMGYAPEYAWMVWIPVLAMGKNLLGKTVPKRLLMYPAMISVDETWSLTAGREVYGFPKNGGPLEIPLPGEEPEKFVASSLAIKKFSPRECATYQPLMTITRTEKDSGLGTVWNDLKDGIHAITKFLEGGPHILPNLGLVEDLVSLAIHEEVPAVFLKQFRDARDGTRACYQAVVEADCKVTAFNGGGLLDGTFEAVAAEFDSFPIASCLGLDPKGVKCEFPFWVNLDFDTTPAKIIWEAGKHG